MRRYWSFIIILFSVILIAGCTHSEENPDKINRFELVSRHHVLVHEFDSLQSLTLGNGKFAFTVDATGLQTFPEVYENGICLGTQSEWGWHSFPNKEKFELKETYQYFEVEGRQIPYAVQWNESGRKQDAANYFRINPHRLHLGNLGFLLLDDNGNQLNPNEIMQINQKLDLWEGSIYSSFQVEDDKVEVKTIVHPEYDLISAEVNSERISEGKLGFQIHLPYPDGEHVSDGANWNNPDKHHSKIIQEDQFHAVILHSLDTTSYFIRLSWNKSATLNNEKPHLFTLLPESESKNFVVSAEFKSKNTFESDISFNEISEASSAVWMNFWESGGAVDFSQTDDERARELERRVILSQYLMRAQCASSYPPQETGLTFNSWYGKHHLEMHWWHGVHWALWNRTELLEKSLDYYLSIFQQAKSKAELQGYKGVRWPKMTGPSGKDSPSGVGEFLIWQQPHIIYFAELVYRNNPDSKIQEKYAPLIFATADFMADFARWDETDERYILGPPLIPAQESLEKEKTVNPPFELQYWKWALSTAQIWRKRMSLPEKENWQKVIDHLPEPAQKNGRYLAAESAPDSYENEHYYSDHPMVLGAFGMLPGTTNLDTSVMSNTFDYIEENWNWDRTWGWDYPMAAMSATRLEKPEDAVNLLLKDVLKNTYLNNGHNYQGNRLRIYLPGNGGLLTAVAMMCAGFEGNDRNNPGFPENWKVRWENLEPLF